MKNPLFKIILIIFLSIGITTAINQKSIKTTTSEEIVKQPKSIQKPEQPTTKKYEISIKTPEFLNYPQTIEQLKKWNKETPELTEIGTYGKSSKGTELYYIRVNNKNIQNEKKPVVMVTACIHGNEPWASSITMAYIGNLLAEYSEKKETTDLINSRDIYFIPVVSPDSYMKNRFVDNVDPNRDFSTPNNPNHKSTPSVAALTDFFWKIRPVAVISGHTFGRLFLIPYGDNYGKSFHEKEYTKIVGRMSEMTGYKKMHCAELYSKPIQGSEVDWFYRNGAMSVVIEFGTHQHVPTYDEIVSEYKRTKKAIDHFIIESPQVKITVADEEVDFSKNTGISRNYQKLLNGELAPIGPY